MIPRLLGVYQVHSSQIYVHNMMTGVDKAYNLEGKSQVEISLVQVTQYAQIITD